MLSCKPRNSVIPGHDLGGMNGMHVNATPGAAWMSRRRLTCLIQLDHSPFLAHRRTYRPREYAEVFVGLRGHEN